MARKRTSIPKTKNTRNRPATKRSQILAFRIGDVFATKYRIVSPRHKRRSARADALGEGGSGVVYLAEQTLHEGVTVKRALKLFVYRDNIADMTRHRATGPVSATHFTDELLNLSTFNHQNVLKVIEAGLTSTTSGLKIPYLVTEYIEGPTLKDVIERNTLTEILEGDEAYAVELVLQLCRGVGHLHSRHFYHCDIAPKNVFLRGRYPDLQIVVGDLGIGRSKAAPNDAPIFLIGTHNYCPPEVRAILHTDITADQFNTLQPRWDLFGLAKTSLELLNSLADGAVRRPWLAAIRQRLQATVDDKQADSVKALEKTVEWLRPVQNTMAGVQELAESYPSNQPLLVPVEPITTSYRIRQIVNHPAMLRLHRVPQLVMATSLFPGANHTRYEHSLGTYQAVRRYLLALLDDEHFLAAFGPEEIELSLLCALLIGITRFPFSTIIHEIKSTTPGRLKSFSRRSLLDELMESSDFRDRHSRTLLDIIAAQFPRISDVQLRNLVVGDWQNLRSLPEKFIHFVLNSSIDARVVDYLRRDSLHLGISAGNVFDLGDLLPHVVFERGRLLLRSSGMSVVEEIVSLRYWLFNRIYWNRPNRALIAMIRHVLVALLGHCGDAFENGLRGQVLRFSEDDMLSYLKDMAIENDRHDVAEICRLLTMPRPRRFEEVFDCNRGEDDAVSRQICDKICLYNGDELQRLQEELNKSVCKELGLDPNTVQVLVDVPVEKGLMKVGDDLNVITPNGTVVPLDRLSGIVSGVQRSFNEQLQRVRIFLNPETDEILVLERKNRLRNHIRSVLEALA